jgi:integrase
MVKPGEKDIYGLEAKFKAAKLNFTEGANRPTYGRGGLRNPWADRNVSDRNKQLVIEFDEYYSFKGRALQSRYKHFCTLAKLTQEVGKDLDKLTKEDVQRYIVGLNNSTFAAKTIQIKKVSMKLLVRWLAKEKGLCEPLWAWMNEGVNTTLPTRNVNETVGLDKSNLLSDEEAMDFIRFAHGMERAFLFTLYETGARIGEILTLARADVNFTGDGYALLTLRGKTGKREVPIKDAVGDLIAWLNCLPNKPEQPLWIVSATRGAGGRFNYRSMARHIYVLGERWQATKAQPWDYAKIRAKLHPHNWRHSRATELARRGWSEYEMCTFFGWKVGSKIPGVYISLTGKDLVSRVRRDHGDAEEVLEGSKLSNKKCSLCGLEQSAANGLCEKCGTPLSLKDFVPWYEKRKKADEVIGQFMEMALKPHRRISYKKLSEAAKNAGYEPRVK